MIDVKKICDTAFQEWMHQPSAGTSEDSQNQQLAHVEILMTRYHEALKEELEKQGIHI